MNRLRLDRKAWRPHNTLWRRLPTPSPTASSQRGHVGPNPLRVCLATHAAVRLQVGALVSVDAPRRLFPKSSRVPRCPTLPHLLPPSFDVPHRGGRHCRREQRHPPQTHRGDATTGGYTCTLHRLQPLRQPWQRKRIERRRAMCHRRFVAHELLATRECHDGLATPRHHLGGLLALAAVPPLTG